MVRFWPWSTSRPPSARCRSRSPAPPVIRWPTCPAWRCAASPTSTPAAPKPTPGTHFVIADAARSLPHTLRPVDVGDEALAELEVLVGFDDDLAGEATRLSNRIRGLLTGIHPTLEHAIGPRISHPAVLEILSRCGGPAGIAKAGRRKLTAIAKVHAPRLGEKLVETIMATLGEQTGHRSGHRRRGHGLAAVGRQLENGSAATQTSRRAGRGDT